MKKWFGVLLIAFGIAFILEQVGVMEFKDILQKSWPVILIIIGLVQIFNRKSTSKMFGFIMVMLGGLFLANQWIDFNVWAYFWPIILILIGFSFLFSQRSFGSMPNNDQYLKAFTLFSGVQVRNLSHQFKGGDITAIFGEARIDLRQSRIDENGAKLGITTLFGGATLYIPENVQVELSGMPIFGGWDNQTKEMPDTEGMPVLKIHSHNIFGGLVIKN